MAKPEAAQHPFPSFRYESIHGQPTFVATDFHGDTWSQDGLQGFGDINFLPGMTRLADCYPIPAVWTTNHDRACPSQAASQGHPLANRWRCLDHGAALSTTCHAWCAPNEFDTGDQLVDAASQSLPWRKFLLKINSIKPHSICQQSVGWKGLYVIGLDGVSVSALSDTIGAIYDCALDPQQWPDTCRKIATLCESKAGGICVHDLRHTQNDQLFVFGYQQQFLEKLGQNYAESPMAASDVVANLGDVKVLSIENNDLYESRFFREVLKQFGLQDIIWFPALRTGGRMASMHASRGEKAPHYREREISLFKVLSPHVCRVLAISDTLDIRALRSEMLERTLDGLVSGVYLTARDGRVVYMNAAAERQVKTGKSIRIVNSRVSPTDPATRAALSKAIDETARDEIEKDMREHSLAIPDVDGGPGYIATLLPVSHGQRRDIFAPFAASVALFTKDPIETPLLPGEAFARLYKLTGGELRVLLALAQGLGGKEAADMLNISEPTIRSHLQRIYSKTDTVGQPDLLRLFQNATPPVRQPQQHGEEHRRFG